MKRKVVALVAVVLLLAMSISGCNLEALNDALDRFYQQFQMGMMTPFEEMEYVRPEMAEFRTLLQQTLEEIPTQTDADELMKSVYALYTFYYDFSTNYNLANIHYFLNMTDIYWQQEYNWCLENSNEVSAGMDRLLYALADSTLKEELEKDHFGEDFFDLYEGESLWDESFTELMNQEAALLEEYYRLSGLAAEVEQYSQAYFEGYGAQIEEVFIQLVALRQQIAADAGYDSYPAFAYEFYYYRDYTPEQTAGYLDEIQRELVPLYENLSSEVWQPLYESCTQGQMYAYVYSCATALGGVAENAFQAMESGGLYDITYSENKYDASFEVYLMNYYSPFVFVNPMMYTQDQLTFVHEFGHFCNDYAAGGTVVGIDVAEIFSQGLEYLSLCYVEAGEKLTQAKMSDSLCVFVEQSAYAWFEQEVYALDAEELTVEAVRSLYQQTSERYGFDSPYRDHREYTLIPHLFMSPMYVISYVVSNDLAMQIYQQELKNAGAGVELWEDSLFTEQVGLLGFVEETGMVSPFEEGRIAQIRDTLEEKLGLG